MALTVLTHAGIGIGDLETRALSGDRGVQRTLAESYYVDSDVEQNYAQAAHWFLLLAQYGDTGSQTNIGLMFARGWGVEKNYREAQNCGILLQ